MMFEDSLVEHPLQRRVVVGREGQAQQGRKVVPGETKKGATKGFPWLQ